MQMTQIQVCDRPSILVCMTSLTVLLGIHQGHPHLHIRVPVSAPFAPHLFIHQ